MYHIAVEELIPLTIYRMGHETQECIRTGSGIVLNCRKASRKTSQALMVNVYDMFGDLTVTHHD
jgi:hypothetical protein